jgi:hypothetical protein
MLTSGDFQTRGTIGAIAATDVNKFIRVGTATTTATITSPIAALTGPAYIMIFNTTTTKAEVWFDNDWSVAGGTELAFTFDNMTTGVTDPNYTGLTNNRIFAA